MLFFFGFIEAKLNNRKLYWGLGIFFFGDCYEEVERKETKRKTETERWTGRVTECDKYVKSELLRQRVGEREREREIDAKIQKDRVTKTKCVRETLRYIQRERERERH